MVAQCGTENGEHITEGAYYSKKNSQSAFLGGTFFSKSFEFLTRVKYTSKIDFYHVVTQVEYWKQWSPTGFPSVFTVFFEKQSKNSKSGGKFLFLLPKCMTENEALRY